MTTVHYIIEGTVQGVGFRRYVLHHANRLQLLGSVGNLDDGTVECVAQGASDAVSELELLLRQGPRFCTVSNLICTDLETEPRRYTQFRII